MRLVRQLEPAGTYFSDKTAPPHASSETSKALGLPGKATDKATRPLLPPATCLGILLFAASFGSLLRGHQQEDALDS